jgi:hypothetical protein
VEWLIRGVGPVPYGVRLAEGPEGVRNGTPLTGFSPPSRSEARAFAPVSVAPRLRQTNQATRNSPEQSPESADGRRLPNRRKVMVWMTFVTLGRQQNAHELPFRSRTGSATA